MEPDNHHMTEFEDLNVRHDRTRNTSKSVTVDRQALIHMLTDHASMLEAFGRLGRVDPRAETIAARHHPDPSNLAASGRRRREAWRQRGEGRFPDGLGGSGRGPGRPSWRT